jgi:cbb3-type cytochrome c oxidase subunit III
MFTLSLRRRDLPGSFLPQDQVRVARFGEREFSPDGETIFLAFCSGCHGERGEGRQTPGVMTFPAIANPDLHRLVSDDFILSAVAKGRQGRRMPAWGEMEGGLEPEEIRAAVAHLRRLSGTAPVPDAKPPRWLQADSAQGERIYAKACMGCHGQVGQGDEGPALRDPALLAEATDAFLVETISRGRRGTPMPAFSEPSTVHPTLSRAEIESVAAFVRTWEKKP